MHFVWDAPAGPDSFHVEADEEEWGAFLSSGLVNKKKNEVSRLNLLLCELLLRGNFGGC